MRIVWFGHQESLGSSISLDLNEENNQGEVRSTRDFGVITPVKIKEKRELLESDRDSNCDEDLTSVKAEEEGKQIGLEEL